MDSVSTLCRVVHSAGARGGSSAGSLAAQTLPPRELVHPTSCPHPPMPTPRYVFIPSPSGGPALEGWSLGWQRGGAGPEVPGEPRGESGGEGRALCPLVQKGHSWALLF